PNALIVALAGVGVEVAVGLAVLVLPRQLGLIGALVVVAGRGALRVLEVDLAVVVVVEAVAALVELAGAEELGLAVRVAAVEAQEVAVVAARARPLGAVAADVLGAVVLARLVGAVVHAVVAGLDADVDEAVAAD